MASFRAWICATRSPPTCAVLRHEKGLSQDDLAYGAEISRCYLAQIEKGSYYASLKIIGRLVDALERDTPRVLPRVMGHPALKEPSRVLCWAAPIGEAALVRPLPGPIALADALVFSIACSVYKLRVVLRQERTWRAFSCATPLLPLRTRHPSRRRDQAQPAARVLWP
jgi:transcriptional regulator with XRE-family HTH domain